MFPTTEAFPFEREQDLVFAEFVEKYQRLMISVAYDVVHNYHDAEDAVIDALVRIADNFDIVSSLSEQRRLSYICKAAKNSAINVYIKRKRLFENEFLDDGYLLSVPYADEEDLEMRELVMDCIDELSDKYKTVLLAYYAEGMNVRQIADMFGLTETAVKTRLRRGRKSLEVIYLEKINK